MVVVVDANQVIRQVVLLVSIFVAIFFARFLVSPAHLARSDGCARVWRHLSGRYYPSRLKPNPSRAS